jgi:hypothetical protein
MCLIHLNSYWYSNNNAQYYTSKTNAQYCPNNYFSSLSIFLSKMNIEFETNTVKLFFVKRSFYKIEKAYFSLLGIASSRSTLTGTWRGVTTYKYIRRYSPNSWVEEIPFLAPSLYHPKLMSFCSKKNTNKVYLYP